MRGRGQGSFRTADINCGWVERRQEEKLSWQPPFSTENYKAFCVLELLPLHWNCPSQRESIGRGTRGCWCHTLRDTPGCTQLPSTSEMWCQSQLLLLARPWNFGYSKAGGGSARLTPVHILLPAQGAGRVAGGNDWGAALHLEGSGLSCPWEVGRKGWDVQQGLCSQDMLLPIEATFHFFPMLGRCQAFTALDSFDICFYGTACRTL